MRHAFLITILLTGLVLQAGCKITFKRKNMEKDNVVVNAKGEKEKIRRDRFSSKDKEIITAYFQRDAHKVIRQDMLSYTKISNKLKAGLIRDKVIPRDVQVMPLPLELNSKLTELPVNILRVMVADRVILMNVKTRRILDVFKI